MERYNCVKAASWISVLVLIAIVHSPMLLVATAQPVVRSQSVQLTVGDSLKVTSNRPSIERVMVQGNLSYASIEKPPEYPTDKFAISASMPASYSLELLFNYSNDYRINLFVQAANQPSVNNNSSYYVSSGPFELDIKADFAPKANTSAPLIASLSPWEAFVNWLEKFSQAFPTWVKLVYVAFGIQFLAVGGLWIRRETAKRENGVQHLDAGNKTFLWFDVAYKFLLVSFATIIAVMGGEVVVLFMLRFMFLASPNLLSLWDLFVVGFAAGAVLIAYLVRFTFEKAFDLRPMEDD
jgi:hypothetical protein